VLPPGARKAQPSLRIVRYAQQQCFESLDRGQPALCFERLFGRMQPYRDPLASVAAAGDLLAIPRGVSSNVGEIERGDVRTNARRTAAFLSVASARLRAKRDKAPPFLGHGED